MMTLNARWTTPVLPYGSERESLVRSRRYTSFRWNPPQDSRAEMAGFTLSAVPSLSKAPQLRSRARIPVFAQHLSALSKTQ